MTHLEHGQLTQSRCRVGKLARWPHVNPSGHSRYTTAHRVILGTFTVRTSAP